MKKEVQNSKIIEDIRNLLVSSIQNQQQKMRQFYITFPNCDAVRTKLSWTHYRIQRAKP